MSSKHGQNLNPMSITPKTLYLLRALKGSRAGVAIYQHVQSVLEDFEAHTHQTQEAYRMLVQVLLEESARLLPADSPLLVHLRLIKMRLSLSTSADEIRTLSDQIRSLFATLSEKPSAAPEAALSDLLEEIEDVASWAGTTLTPEKAANHSPQVGSKQSPTPARTPATLSKVPAFQAQPRSRTAAHSPHSAMRAGESPPTGRETSNELGREDRQQAPATTDPPPTPAASTQPLAPITPAQIAEETQAASAEIPASQPGSVLEDKRQRIREIQKTLASHLGEVIKQNEKFGILLEVGHESLRQMDNIDEIGNLKEALIREVTRLMEGHKELTRKLESANRYLQIIESEGQYLNDELTRVHILSLTDELTELPNRRAFMRRLEDEVARVQRYGSPLTLALVDMDGFKKINDTYGHAAGDEVLRNFAHNILSIFRHHDMVARYGGEEFAVILPNTDQHGALRALQKVQKRNAESPYHFDGETRSMPTFSAGIALYRPGETPSSLIERADKALYRAKRLGRNRIELANSDLEATAH